MPDLKKLIVLTGGGTAGHVMPHLAMFPVLSARGWSCHYLGSGGIERGIISSTKIPFSEIATGKLRRYWSWQNFLDLFRIALGTCQSIIWLRRIRPRVIFSKGGFVSVPVCAAAWMLGIPVVTHESDFTPGLATKIIAKFATKILCTFPQTLAHLPAGKSRVVGTPVRREILQGNQNRGLQLCGFDAGDSRPVVLVMGGSQGAEAINRFIESQLTNLLSLYRVVHITGKGKERASLSAQGYATFSYVGEELPHILAASDLAISRAGANTIFELLALEIPMLLIPLEQGSRGDQILNARCFEQLGLARVVRERDLSAGSVLSCLDELSRQIGDRRYEHSPFGRNDAADAIMMSIDEVVG